MKKTIFVFALTFLLLLSPLLSQENKLKVLAGKANIYLSPATNSSIVETVEKGTLLNLFSTGKIQNVWYYVSFYSEKRSSTIVGFIQASLVEMIAEVPKIEEKKLTDTPFLSPKFQVPEEIKIEPKSCIGGAAGYAMPSEDNYGSGLKYGGNFSLGITKNISIELSGLIFQSDVEGNPEALSKGKLSIIPIQLSIQARFPIAGQFVPYLLGGGGYYLNRFTLDKEISDSWDALGFDIEEKVENAIGYHFGAGIDLFFAKNIALNADIRYCLAKIKGSWILTDQIIGIEASGNLEDLNLNSLMLGVGLKFCF